MDDFRLTKKQQCLRFLHLWLNGFTSPWRFANGVKNGPAPWLGLGGVCVRAVLVSLLLYLPLALSGKAPGLRSYLSFIPTSWYYGALIGVAPLVFIFQWFAGSVVAHLVLRIFRQRSDIDVLLNISGMTALVAGGFLLVWDGTCAMLGFSNNTVLIVTHAAFYAWGAALSTYCLKKIFGVPVKIGILANCLSLVFVLPAAIIFLRLPV
jgi:hypothetical protein